MGDPPAVPCPQRSPQRRTCQPACPRLCQPRSPQRRCATWTSLQATGPLGYAVARAVSRASPIQRSPKWRRRLCHPAPPGARARLRRAATVVLPGGCCTRHKRAAPNASCRFMLAETHSRGVKDGCASRPSSHCRSSWRKATCLHLEARTALSGPQRYATRVSANEA
mgnify:CR=1 FL=1